MHLPAKSLTIIKASGQSERFDIRKLVDSLMRSGASEEVAWDIAQKIEKQVTPSSHTKHIFKMAKKLLRKYNHVSDMRYSMKKAIYALGPSGYQFEKYFGRILKEYGYTVEVNRMLQGYCVMHEIDVFATKDDEGFVIECKYHSDGGIPTDVKVALYIHSRFEDIRRAYVETSANKISIKSGWLVTNTRCSSDAIRFAECVGLKIVSWKYPERESLERMIENKRLYPVTILSSVKKNLLDILFRNGIILAREIADMDEQTFKRTSGIDEDVASILKREADELCS